MGTEDETFFSRGANQNEATLDLTDKVPDTKEWLTEEIARLEANPSETSESHIENLKKRLARLEEEGK